MKTAIKLNKEQGLYIIPFGNGFTTYGFDVVFNRAKKLALELNVPFAPKRRGTMKVYEAYLKLLKVLERRYKETGFRSQSDLIPEFIGKEGKRVEIIDRHGEKRRFIIGKSTGVLPCHLEIAKSNSTGGGSVTGYPFKKLTFLS